MPHSRPDPRSGRIEVICGCMFAGKTARLIEHLSAARAAGLRVSAFKHTLDDRYAPTELATHDKRHFTAHAVPDADAIEAGARDADVIGIDEAQFFGPRLAEVCAGLREHGKRVILAGIDHNAWGLPFTPLPQLKEIADNIESMHAPCGVCGEPARFSQRIVPVVGGRMVGGPREYEPRCERCFVPLAGSPPSA